MAQALVAEFRISITYALNGFSHKHRAYCQATSLSDPTPVLVGRNGDLTDWDDCALGLWTAIGDIADADTDGATALLEQRSGIIWLPIAGTSLPDIAQGVTYTPASQYTLVLRDTAFKFIRVVVMEPGQGVYVGHSANGAGINLYTDNMLERYDGTNADLTAPYNWQKSRGDRYILASGMVAGGTYDLNDKMKRARGLE